MKSIVLFILILNIFNCFSSSGQSWLWGKQSVDAIKTGLTAGNVATNHTGNVYNTGAFATLIIFGTHVLTTSASPEAYLVKYDPNGNVLWARQSKSITEGAQGFSVATDDSDNSYITGVSGDVSVFGTDTFLYQAGQVFLVKYDPNGNVVWAKQPPNSTANGYGYSVALDKFGHEYITGTGAFLIKYDRNGNIIWTVRQQNSTNYPSTVGNYVATDASGNIFVSGQFNDSLILGTYKLHSSTTNWGDFIAKFDSNGDVLWVQQIINNTHFPPNFNSGYGQYCVAVDGSGAAYLTGFFSGTITLGSYSFTTASAYTYNFLLAKYTPGGVLEWCKQATPLGGSQWGSHYVFTDDSNHIYISGAGETGPPQTTSFAFGNDTFSVKTLFNNDAPAFVLKLDSSGKTLCGSTLEGGGDYSNSIASDPSGRFVYLDGEFTTSFTIANDSLANYSGGEDNYVGRWQACSSCALAVNITPQTPTFCSGQGVTLYANGGKNYTWSPATGLSATSGNSVVANPAVTTTYFLSETDSSGCSGLATDVVTVKPSPFANFNFSANGNQVTFNSAGSSSDVTSYSWNFGDSTTSNLANPVHNFSTKDTFNVCLTVYNGSNCSYTLCKTVDLLDEGINNITSQNSIQLYPNPATKELAVGSWQLAGSEIEILDILGRTLLVQKADNNLTTIDVSSLAAGIYFVEIKSEQGIAVKKFAKE